MEEHGRKYIVASMDAGAACIEDGIRSTFIEVGGSLHGNICVSRCKFSWKKMKLLNEATSMDTSLEVN